MPNEAGRPADAIGRIEETIVAMDVWHVALPVTSRRDHGIGTVADQVEVVIVRLTSESGEKGYGEASPWAVFTGTPEGNFAALDRYIRPHVIGARLANLHDIMAKARLAVVNCTEAKAGLETALHDLAGRIAGKPVWSLLGKKCRSEIPLSVSLANPDFDADLELVARLRADGIGIVKLKTGFSDHAFDMMRIERLRKDYPDLDIRIDYNQGLDVASALNQLPEIDAMAPSFIEQPVAAHQYTAMALLREKTKAPLLADESVFGQEDMHRAVRESICDCVSVKIMKSGGLTQGRKVAEIAGENNIAAYGGDMFETGIAHLAGTHMIATSPNISLGCEFYHATYYLVEDLLDEPFPVANGKVQVPNSAGLGVSVNQQRIEKYALHHSTGAA